jgi:hypothetical protein
MDGISTGYSGPGMVGGNDQYPGFQGGFGGISTGYSGPGVSDGSGLKSPIDWAIESMKNLPGHLPGPYDFIRAKCMDEIL